MLGSPRIGTRQQGIIFKQSILTQVFVFSCRKVLDDLLDYRHYHWLLYRDVLLTGKMSSSLHLVS